MQMCWRAGRATRGHSRNVTPASGSASDHDAERPVRMAGNDGVLRRSHCRGRFRCHHGREPRGMPRSAAQAACLAGGRESAHERNSVQMAEMLNE